MSGLCGFGREPGVRRLPRPGIAGGHHGLVSLPGLPGRGSRGGSGPGVDRLVPFRLTVCALWGRRSPARGGNAPRAAARGLAAPPKGAARGVQPRCIYGAAKRPGRRAAGGIPGAPSRGARKAAASSRQALRVRRASVVTTVELARPGSDDAVRRGTCNPETLVVHGVADSGVERRKSAGKCRAAESRFFAPGIGGLRPMFDLVRKAESDAQLAGQGFASQRG